MPIKLRIEEAIKKSGLSNAEVARRLDTTPQAVNGWLRTGRIGKAMLAKLALLTACNVEWLIGGDGDPWRAEEPRAGYSPTSDRYAMIPRYQVTGSLGHGIENEHEEISGTHAYRRDWLERKKLVPAACVVIDAVGESMQPTIGDGDVVLINTLEKKIANGQVYAFNTEDGVRIKRLFRQLDGRVRVCSDNPDKITYPDEWLTPGMDVAIIGRVVHRSGGV